MTTATSPARLFDLTGRRAVVTGASRGIGARAAQVLDAAGAKVALVARDKNRLQDVAATLGNESLVLPADLSLPDTAERLAAELDERWGGTDILVNNAGLSRPGPATALPTKDWDDVMAVNLRGMFTLTRCLAPGMLDRGWGRIVMVSSALGLVGEAQAAAYVSSKSAVLGLTRSLAVEWAPKGVTVNSLCPGWVDTDMVSDLLADPRFHRRAMRRIAVGRWGEPPDLDGALLLLASPASAYLTGQAIVVDGGLVAGW
ncbi:SDR family NAD(P)-dependent oxidoreductase [Amycolatopsis echigonensis]|uniref:SDR family oxidoreductase n=1 Tax=Amycolatopsis echigonensis TaxID=2576905 RepID=A0A8E2BAL6_9PSEU|nr:SDR family NAD(P)-dependent oxidoreductase [Amycolatopsis echigonensis]MBB2505233.1 SDR family oxidoreductase [Amycolatopsis echigonensis]